MTSPFFLITLGFVMSQSVSVEPSPQFRPIGPYPVTLRPLVTERIGDPALCQSLPAGGGRFVVMYPAVKDQAPPTPTEPGLYMVNVERRTVEALVLGRPTCVRVVQDKIDVTWMLMTAQTREGDVVSNQYYALVFTRPKQQLTAQTRDPNAPPTPQQDSVKSEVQISPLVLERFDAGSAGRAAGKIPLTTEIRVGGYYIADLDGDEYPDIRIDVVEKDIESGQSVQRSVSFLYSDGGFVERPDDGGKES